MPARVFTLYAKWATADIKGKTFNKVDTTIEWKSEEAKNAILAEMKMTEEQFNEMQKASMVTFVFATDTETVTVTFDQNLGEESDRGSFLGASGCIAAIRYGMLRPNTGKVPSGAMKRSSTIEYF